MRKSFLIFLIALGLPPPLIQLLWVPIMELITQLTFVGVIETEASASLSAQCANGKESGQEGRNEGIYDGRKEEGQWGCDPEQKLGW